MFGFLFGWRKASKCKKLIKRLRCRLKLLKNKRCSIIRHSRKDMANLITNGYEQTAFNRTEQLIKDESTVTVYEMLDNFCEFILINLSYIRRHKDVPNDINEAVSSLIFASARCGDLPELQHIRRLFEERYGQKFSMTALELCPGNLVNDLIKEKLRIKTVPEDAKRRLVDEITKDCIKTEVLALEYSSEWHQKQVKEKEEPRTCYLITYEPESQDPNIYADSSYSNKLAVVPYESTNHTCQDIDPKATVSSNSPSQLIVSSYKGEIKTERASSSESLPQFSVDTIVYLDDILELHSTPAKEENFQDQRVFKFKSNGMSKKYSFRESLENKDESWIERLRMKNSRNSRNESWKRTRVRSVSKKRQKIKDSECISYYSQSLKTNAEKRHKSHYHMQHLRKLMAEDGKRKTCMEVRSNILACKCYYNTNSHEINDCSLEYPCYFCTTGDKEDGEVTTWKRKIGITTPEGFSTQNHQKEKPQHEFKRYDSFSNESWDRETDPDFFSEKNPKRSSKNGAKTGNVLAKSDDQSIKQNAEILKNPKKEEDCSESLSLIVKDNTKQTRALTSYLRAVTMPPERPKDIHKDIILRSNSYPNKHPDHVHPKLPDYDDIAAKFKSLKKEHLEKTLSTSKTIETQSVYVA